MDKFSEIESFLKVVEAGSFSRAAERLNIGKSSVSRRIADLEERLGAQLFKRTTRKIHLTETGEAFYRQCAQIFNDLEEAELAASNNQTELKGKLKVAAPLSFGLLHLKPVIDDFMQSYPAIQFDLDFNDRYVDLIDEGFDVAIRIGKLSDSSLIARKLAVMKCVAAASPEFWDIHGRPETPQQLESLPCYRYSNTNRPEVIRYNCPPGNSGEIRPPLQLLANNGDFVRDIAIEGRGFIIEPVFFLTKQIEGRQLEPVLLDCAWEETILWVVYPPTRKLSNRVRVFVDTLITRFDGNPYWDKCLQD